MKRVLCHILITIHTYIHVRKYTCNVNVSLYVRSVSQRKGSKNRGCRPSWLGDINPAGILKCVSRIAPSSFSSDDRLWTMTCPQLCSIARTWSAQSATALSLSPSRFHVGILYAQTASRHAFVQLAQVCAPAVIFIYSPWQSRSHQLSY